MYVLFWSIYPSILSISVIPSIPLSIVLLIVLSFFQLIIHTSVRRLSVYLSIYLSIYRFCVSFYRSSLCLFIFCFLYQSVCLSSYLSFCFCLSLYLCFSCNIHVHLNILECREKDKRTFCNLLFYLESGTYCVPQFILLIVI